MHPGIAVQREPVVREVDDLVKLVLPPLTDAVPPFQINDPQVAQGPTAELMRTRLFPEEVDDVLNTFQTPWIGVVPDSFLKSETDPFKVFQVFDQFVGKITRLSESRYFDERERKIRRYTNKRFKVGRQTVRAKIVENPTSLGFDGIVFELIADGKSYKLKIYRDEIDHTKRNRSGNLIKVGPRSEISDALHFMNIPICDLTYFHFGNPEAGWAVFEWFDFAQPISNRPGPRLRDVGMLEDDHPYLAPAARTNSRGGMIFDHGRIEEQREQDAIIRALFEFRGPPASFLFRFNDLSEIPEELRTMTILDMTCFYPQSAELIQHKIMDVPLHERAEALKFFLHSKVLGPMRMDPRLLLEESWGNYWPAAESAIWKAKYQTREFDAEVEKLFSFA